MKSNNKNRNKGDNNWGWIIIAVFIIIFLIFWAILKYKKDKKRFEWLQLRKGKLRSVIQKKRNKKRWLDWAFRLAYPIARIILVGIWLWYNYLAKFYFEKPLELGDYVTWNAAGLIIFSALMFLFIGPFDFTNAIKQVKPTIEFWVYSKYLGIGDMISANENELKKIEQEIDSLDNAYNFIDDNQN